MFLGVVDDKALVRQDHRAMVRIQLIGIAMTVCGAGALGCLLTADGPPRWIAWPVVVVIVVTNGYAGRKRAVAYAEGWVDGRTELVASMGEATARGMSAEEWANAEQARTLAVFGLGITDLSAPDKD